MFPAFDCSVLLLQQPRSHRFSLHHNFKRHYPKAIHPKPSTAVLSLPLLDEKLIENSTLVFLLAKQEKQKKAMTKKDTGPKTGNNIQAEGEQREREKRRFLDVGRVQADHQHCSAEKRYVSSVGPPK